MSISRLSIRRPVAVAMLFLAAALLGLISFTRLPIDLLPDIAYPRLVVYTTYPDVAPSEVERFLTEPIEQVVVSVPGVDGVESVSREGMSLVTIRFAWGTDMDFAMLNVREKLDNIRDALPEQASRPVVLRTDPTAEPILAVTVAGDIDLFSLKELSETVFKRRLEQIDGVAQAALAGGLEREIHVDVDPGKLEAHGLSIQQISQALDAANQSAPGGSILRGRYRYALRTLGEFQSVDEIGSVVLAQRLEDGATAPSGMITLDDVADIEDGFKERESIARYNGAEAVGLLVFKESGANTVHVAEAVNEVLDRLRVEYPEVELQVAMSQAGFIADSISNVVQALIYGGALAFLVLFLFLRDARYPIAIALAIPISVASTFALLDLASVSLNIMSLGGLALGVGMLVDNSIVVLENVFRHRERGASMEEAAGLGADEVRGAITASTLTTISVFGPIIYVQGVAGQLFRPLSLAVAFSLTTSLIVALTLLPTMAARLGGDSRAAQLGLVRRAIRVALVKLGTAIGRAFRPALDLFDRQFTKFANWYHGVLIVALDHRGRVVGIAAALLLVGIGVGLLLNRGVLPDVDQGAFRVRLEFDPGTPIEQTNEAARELEAAFRANPDVAALFTRVGRQLAIAGVEEEESGLHTAVLEVRVRDGARTTKVTEQLRPVLPRFPPGVLAIETGTATALGKLLGGGEADLAVRIRGDDLNRAYAYGGEIAGRLTTIPSLANVRVGTEAGQPEIQIEIDRDRAAAFGIELRLIAETVGNYMRGAVATEYVDFDRRVPIVVRLPESQRRSLETLDQLTVDGVPLRELIVMREAVGPAEVRRTEQTRTVTVFADVAQGGLDRALQDVQAALRRLPAPQGLRTEIGGENEERDRSFRDLAFAFTLAVLLVYMILAAQFESFFHPFTILLSVPLATVGASLALWITGAGLNTMSLIGVVVLVGIVVNDAIVKVDFINQMRRQGLPTRKAILEAGRVRLRPILMTTATTVLGLTPMALGLGRGADLRAPLAIAVIGGLISATALTLIVVPVAYDLIETARTKFRTMLRASAPAPHPQAGD